MTSLSRLPLSTPALALSVCAATLLTTLPTPAWAAAGDRSAAEAALAEVEKAGPESKPAAMPVAAAKQALSRAQAARNGGDGAMGELLEGLAKTHAEMARDVLRAAKIEAERMTAESRTTELTTDTERKRALLEEIAARKQRAATDLAAAEAAAAARPAKPEGKTDTKGEGKKVSATGEVKADAKAGVKAVAKPAPKKASGK